MPEHKGELTVQQLRTVFEVPTMVSKDGHVSQEELQFLLQGGS